MRSSSSGAERYASVGSSCSDWSSCSGGKSRVTPRSWLATLAALAVATLLIGLWLVRVAIPEADTLHLRTGRAVHRQLVVAVMSRAGASERRASIRRTWATLIPEHQVAPCDDWDRADAAVHLCFLVEQSPDLEDARDLFIVPGEPDSGLWVNGGGTAAAAAASSTSAATALHAAAERSRSFAMLRDPGVTSLAAKLAFFLDRVRDHHELMFDHVLRVDDDGFVNLGPLLAELAVRPRERLVWGYFHAPPKRVRADENFLILSHDVAHRVADGWAQAVESRVRALLFGGGSTIGRWLSGLDLHRFHDGRLVQSNVHFVLSDGSRSSSLQLRPLQFCQSFLYCHKCSGVTFDELAHACRTVWSNGGGSGGVGDRPTALVYPAQEFLAGLQAPMKACIERAATVQGPHVHPVPCPDSSSGSFITLSEARAAQALLLLPANAAGPLPMSVVLADRAATGRDPGPWLRFAEEAASSPSSSSNSRRLEATEESQHALATLRLVPLERPSTDAWVVPPILTPLAAALKVAPPHAGVLARDLDHLHLATEQLI